MSARILVTGGTGYVGAPVVEELLERGDEVRVLDILLHGQRELADRRRNLARRCKDERQVGMPRELRD